MSNEYPQGGPLPTIQKLAGEIQEIAKNYPPTPPSAQADLKMHMEGLGKQIRAARKIVEYAADIQKQAAKLLEFPERYLTP